MRHQILKIFRSKGGASLKLSKGNPWAFKQQTSFFPNEVHWNILNKKFIIKEEFSPSLKSRDFLKISTNFCFKEIFSPLRASFNSLLKITSFMGLWTKVSPFQLSFLFSMNFCSLQTLFSESHAKSFINRDPSLLPRIKFNKVLVDNSNFSPTIPFINKLLIGCFLS